ncbi:MAG: OB-fold nucleic acid binding domain-containing protein [Candidatus Diapherotrites archaeon]
MRGDDMKVSELKARSGVPELTVEVVSIGEPRKFANEKGSGRVASAAVKDKTGEVRMSLWNEQIDQIKEGDKIKIENGWCSEYNGELQVSTGRNGTISPAE